LQEKKQINLAMLLVCTHTEREEKQKVKRNLSIYSNNYNSDEDWFLLRFDNFIYETNKRKIQVLRNRIRKKLETPTATRSNKILFFYFC